MPVNRPCVSQLTPSWRVRMADAGAPVLEAPRADTPTQMLDVAERLFARNGIDKVSIREIVRASGQSNLSAAHYHFGSREALVGALIARRIRVINTIRHQRLDALVAAGQDGSVHAIVSATIQVLAQIVRTESWGPDYVRVVSQVLMRPQLHLETYLDSDTMGGHIRCTAMLRRLLPELPPRVFKDRVWIVNNEATYSLARWIQAHGPVTSSTSRRYASLIRNTTDFLAAGLAAPVGAPDADAAQDIPEGTLP